MSSKNNVKSKNDSKLEEILKITQDKINNAEQKNEEASVTSVIEKEQEVENELVIKKLSVSEKKDEGKKKTESYYMPEQLANDIITYAKSLNRSKSEVITKILAMYINNIKKENPEIFKKEE